MTKKGYCRICRFMQKHGEFGLESEWLGFIRDGRMNYSGLIAWLESKGCRVSRSTLQRHLHRCTPSDYEIRRSNIEARKRHSGRSKTPLVLNKERKKLTLREMGYGILSRRGRNEGLE